MSRAKKAWHTALAFSVKSDVASGESPETGMTCSALSAGVMVLGVARAEIENSHLMSAYGILIDPLRFTDGSNGV